MFGWSLAMTAAASGLVGAQSTLSADSMVPARFVAAVMGALPFFDDPQVLAGKVPGELGRRLAIPRSTRVLGTLVALPFQVVVFESHRTADSLLAEVQRELIAHGWRRKPRRHDEGGFVSPTEDSREWCAAGDLLVVSVTSRAGGGSTARYVIARGQFAASCDRDDQAKGLELPTLYHPGRSEPPGSACKAPLAPSASLADDELITSTLSAEQLMEHYGRQLREGGWTLPHPGGEGASLERTWIRRSGAGDLERVTIHVSIPAAQPNCRQLHMRIQTP